MKDPGPLPPRLERFYWDLLNRLPKLQRKGAIDSTVVKEFEVRYERRLAGERRHSGPLDLV